MGKFPQGKFQFCVIFLLMYIIIRKYIILAFGKIFIENFVVCMRTKNINKQQQIFFLIEFEFSILHKCFVFLELILFVHY